METSYTVLESVGTLTVSLAVLAPDPSLFTDRLVNTIIAMVVSSVNDSAQGVLFFLSVNAQQLHVMLFLV